MAHPWPSAPNWEGLLKGATFGVSHRRISTEITIFFAKQYCSPEIVLVDSFIDVQKRLFARHFIETVMDSSRSTPKASPIFSPWYHGCRGAPLPDTIGGAIKAEERTFI